MSKEYVKEVRILLKELEELEESYLKARTEKKALELRKARIEADVQRTVSFDTTLKNESQRSSAFNVGKFRNSEWVEITEKKLPELETEYIGLYFDIRRAHLLLSAITGVESRIDVL